MSGVKLAILIPTHNRVNSIERLLHSIYAELEEIEDKVIVVVIDDGSSDGTSNLLKGFQRLNVVQGSGDWWFTRSVNEGLKRAATFKPDYFTILNDDVLLPKGFILDVLSVAKSRTGPFIFAPIGLTHGDQKRIVFSGVLKRDRITGTLKTYLPYHSDYNVGMGGEHPSIVLPGRGMTFSQEAFKTLGSLNEALPQYASDFEYALRGNKLGFDVFVTWDVVIFADERQTDPNAIQKKPPFGKFLGSLINDKSKNYILNGFIVSWALGEYWLAPFRILFSLVFSLRKYFLTQ